MGRLGPQCDLGADAELKPANHIRVLLQRGFAPCRRDVEEMAFNLAEKLEIRHKFNKELGRVGTHWFLSVIDRNKSLSIRKAEGLSVIRAKGMSKEDVSNYFNLLQKLLLENEPCIHFTRF